MVEIRFFAQGRQVIDLHWVSAALMGCLLFASFWRQSDSFLALVAFCEMGMVDVSNLCCIRQTRKCMAQVFVDSSWAQFSSSLGQICSPVVVV